MHRFTKPATNYRFGGSNPSLSVVPSNPADLAGLVIVSEFVLSKYIGLVLLVVVSEIL